MSANNWGYSTDGTDFYPIPINGMPHRIGKTEEPSPEDPGYNASQLTFGAKIGDNVASGVYSDTVVLTAYVNGPDDLAYKEDEDGEFTVQTILYDKNTPTYDMQSFSCDDVAAGGVAIVTDTRDGNKYPMKKLKDGNCWMLQNLRITNKTLTPADSNVSSNFVLKASNLNDFKQDETGGELHPNPDINAVYYDDTYGAYYTWYTVTAGTSASIEFSGYTEEELEAIEDEIYELLGVENYSDMRNKIDEIKTILNNDDPDDDATLTENQLLAYQKYNEVNTYYNELEENYMEFDETTSSVCPKGWKLPTIEHIYSLAMQYGAQSSSSASPYASLPIVNNNSYAGLIKYEPINNIAPSSEYSMSQYVGNIGTGTAGAVNKLFVGEAGVSWLSSYANDAIMGSSRIDEITPLTFPVQKGTSTEFGRASIIPKSSIGKYSYGFTARCISGSVEPPSLREIFGEG